MKKILTILAATATMFAFGEDINHGANFEADAFTPGQTYSTLDVNLGANYNDVNVAGTPRYWYTTDTEAANIISNYPASGTGVPIASRPDKFADDQNSNYLQVETTGRLYRSVKDNTGSGDFTNSTDYACSIASNPIYLDTLVKFTAADSVFGPEALENGDKIAIEYVEHESEGPGDDPVTNFVIRAGYFDQTVGVIATNYFAAVPADFDKDAWHRLTVRTFASIDTANHVGFVVYLDGTPLEYEDTVLAGDDFTANGAAANVYKEGCHALYPSFVQGGDFQYSISAAAFSGNGSLDDVVFTTTTPNFITSGEAVRTEITLGTGVAGVTVTVGENEIDPLDATATPLVFNLPARTTSFVLDVTADTANGYTFDAATGITASNDVTYVGTTITITGGSPALTVVGKRDNAYYMDGETKVGFATLSEAFASAPANATIKLGYNYSVADNETTSPIDPVYTITENLVLDLNGKTLDGGSSNARFLFSTDTDKTLTVIDSVSGDTGKIIYGGSYGIFGGNGDAYLGSNDLTDYGPVIDGAICGEQGWVSEVVRGKFTASDNTGTIDPETYQVTNPDGFVSEFMLAQGSSSELVSGYWVVSTGAQPQPTTYAISWTLTGGTTEATAGDFEENDTIVFTAETGKTLSFVSINGTEIADTSVYGASSYTYTVGTAAATLVVTFTGSSYPSYIDDANKQGKYDTWKTAMTAAGVDVGDGEAYEDAYLLNCKPTEVTAEKAAFKFTKIAFEGGVWVTETTTKNTSGADYNGTVTVTRYSDVGCTTESSTGTFFKAFLQ